MKKYKNIIQNEVQKQVRQNVFTNSS